MELADPRIISRVEKAISRLFTFRIAMMNSNLPITYNHITIQVQNVLTLLIGFMFVGLLFGLTLQRLGVRHRQLAGLIQTVGWGFLVLMPALVFWITSTPSLVYGTPYWNYLVAIWYSGLIIIWFVFVEVFAFDRPYSRKLAKLVPRKWKSWWSKPSLRPSIYQAWLGSLFSYFS